VPIQAVSLGLGAVPVGAFVDEHVRGVLDLLAGQRPLYLIQMGHSSS
jgi:nitroreductase